ncbi:hypothetical protein [Hymenobacter bucti]|uniref:Uncharacterized protein n=1 Tax=Hymenobacter bucti TaxID=1844114 RepID=A0ABW4QRA4_9BACT
MKLLLAFATLCALGATAAQAQTVLPSGAVAPAGAVVNPTGVPVTPATVPGSQPLSTPATRDGGSPRASRRDEKVPGMSREDRKRIRKMGKVKYSADSEKPSGKK